MTDLVDLSTEKWWTWWSVDYAPDLSAAEIAAIKAQAPGIISTVRHYPNQAPPGMSLTHMSVSGNNYNIIGDQLVEICTNLGLGDGEVNVWLQNIGMGDDGPVGSDIPALVRHTADALDPLSAVYSASLPSYSYALGRARLWMCPWCENGIAETKPFWQGVVQRWVDRKNNDLPGLPLPNRFHWDLEYTFGPLDSPQYSPGVFLDCLNDPRANTNLLQPFGKTMAQLYSEYIPTIPTGSRAPIPGDSGTGTGGDYGTDGRIPALRHWFNWWQGINMSHRDAVLNEALYQPARDILGAQGVTALHSNWLSSLQYDGLGSPPRLYSQRFRGSSGEHLWMGWEQFASADMHAPVYYPHWSGMGWEESGEDWVDAAVRRIATLIDDVILSHGGTAADGVNMVPWMMPNGVSQGQGPWGDWDSVPGSDFPLTYGDFEISVEQFDRMLTAASDKGVREWYLWTWAQGPGSGNASSISGQAWKDMAELWEARQSRQAIERPLRNSEIATLLEITRQQIIQIGVVQQASSLYSPRHGGLSVPVITPAGSTDEYRIRIRKTSGTPTVRLLPEASSIIVEAPE